MRQSSLQYKVTLGYYIVSAMALCLSLFTLVELRTVSQRLISGEQVYLLLNNILEMRRFEKNYLLYHQQEDLNQLRLYTNLVMDRLQAAGQEPFEPMHRKVTEYANLVRHPIDNDATEKAVRTLGKTMVTVAEKGAATEQIQVHMALEKHRFILMIAMGVVVIGILLLGRLVSHWIVLPLQRMEESMVGVLNGQLAPIHIRSNDREILSLSKAFNAVMQELHHRHKHLLRSEKLAAFGTLLSGVAHELNNPLSNISTSCQILSEEVASADLAFRRDLLAQIDEQTCRARNIVRSLLDFSRDREFEKTTFLLAPLIEEVIRFSKGNIPNRIQVRVEIPDGLILLGDRQRLQQAFINLIKNGVDAIPDTGTILIRALPANMTQCPPSLFADCHCCAPWVEIVVQDTGTGIHETYLPRIFDPFFTTKPVGKGSGLGLAVVAEVVEQHEGNIAVVSQVGQGTQFIIRLPVS